MRTSLSTIRPYSWRIQTAGTKNVIRIFNKSCHSAEISRIVDLAREVHSKIRGSSKKPMSEYTLGLCQTAAMILNGKAQKNFENLEEAYVIRGDNIPGSKGYSEIFGLKGVHHLSVLDFPSMSVAVDATVAQIEGKKFDFKNTEALIVITEPKDKWLSAYLTEIFGGGTWLYLILGF